MCQIQIIIDRQNQNCCQNFLRAPARAGCFRPLRHARQSHPCFAPSAVKTIPLPFSHLKFPTGTEVSTCSADSGGALQQRQRLGSCLRPQHWLRSYRRGHCGGRKPKDARLAAPLRFRQGTIHVPRIAALFFLLVSNLTKHGSCRRLPNGADKAGHRRASLRLPRSAARCRDMAQGSSHPMCRGGDPTNGGADPSDLYGLEPLLVRYASRCPQSPSPIRILPELHGISGDSTLTDMLLGFSHVRMRWRGARR